jgi:hypothetical protein
MLLLPSQSRLQSYSNTLFGRTTTWSNDDQAPQILEEHRPAIEAEVADIAILLTYLTHDLSIDLQAVVSKKLVVNERKYPLEKSYGSNKKYTDL